MSDIIGQLKLKLISEHISVGKKYWENMTFFKLKKINWRE